MTDTLDRPDAPPARVRTPRVISDVPSQTDRWFDRVTFASGALVLVILSLIGIFLLLRSRTAISESGVVGFLTTTSWRTDVTPPRIGVLGLLTGTVVVAIIAVAIAVPIGTIVALFIVEYASPKARRVLTGIVDLLAAIPALIFGLWGAYFLSPQLVPLSAFLTDHFSWIPFFRTDPGARLQGSLFIGGIVVSLMVIPIVASVVREVFSRTPAGEKEAALALGSTRWGMIRTVVMPYGKGGIIGGAMLGLGRALGETIALVILLPQVPGVSDRILQNGGATVSGFIAARAGADRFTVSGLMAAGLVLFVITLGTNMMASVIVSRSRSGAGVEL